MAISDALGKFFLGEQASDVELDPRFAAAQRDRERIAAQARGQAFGEGPTQGQLAAQQAGQAATEQLASAQRGAAAGVGGPGALFALQAAQRNTAQGAQDIAGQTARASAEARRVDQESALQRLEGTLSQQEQAAERERLMREDMRQQGFLGVLGAVGGSALGASGLVPGFKGDEGARSGGGLGYGVGRSLEDAFR